MPYVAGIVMYMMKHPEHYLLQLFIAIWDYVEET